MVYLKSPFPPLPPIPDRNVHEILVQPPNGAPPADFTLHVDAVTGKKRTYTEFKRAVELGSTALGAPVADGGLGLSADAGHMVGLYSPNCMEYIAAVNSLIRNATPFALLSMFATVYELTHAIRLSKSTHLLVHAELLPKALAAAKEVGLPEDRIYILDGNVEGKLNLEDMRQAIQKRNVPQLPVKPATSKTLAYLVFSSGTSGLPKAVMISHGNIWAIVYAQVILAETEAAHTKIPPPETPPVWLLFLPFYHTYGLHISCFRQFYTPMTYVIVPRWNTDLVLRIIPKYNINIMPLIPSAIHQIVNHKLFSKTDFSSLRSVSSGAAYLPPDLSKKFMKLLTNAPVILEGYGMSEQTLSAARRPLPGLFGLNAPSGCAGIPIPGMEIKILRADGSHTAIDEPGELWTKGENIALGYFDNPKATAETFIDGWLRTGDSFKADKNGLLFFVDRAKDTLKVSGAQVSPTEIEDTLLDHPDKLVIDVCVAGVSGGRTSDEKIPRAWIVLSEEGQRRGPEEVVKALDGWVKKNLSKYKWVRGGYEVTDVIPKNPTGKVLRRVLVDKYEADHAKKPKSKL